jgi:hypothetical protein
MTEENFGSGRNSLAFALWSLKKTTELLTIRYETRVQINPLSCVSRATECKFGQSIFIHSLNNACTFIMNVVCSM